MTLSPISSMGMAVRLRQSRLCIQKMKDLDRVIYWVALHSVPGLGPVTYRRLLERFGDPRTVLLETSKRDLNSLPWLRYELVKGIFNAKERLADIVNIVKILTYNNIKVVTPAHRGYPSKIRMIKNAPVVLYIRGKYLKRDKKAVAIVGSTRPSDKGYRIAVEAARRLAQKGATIVSGYARGIDTAAHLGAMETVQAGKPGRTIMVIPTGFDHFVWKATLRPYAHNSSRYSIISESFPNQEWSVGAALSRNRLIASLSDAVFVVETDVGGGAAHTFFHAKTLGRMTFALKYSKPPTSAMGNESILSQGATPISSFKDLDKITAFL
ncbi:MAG: DNA-processing protein DprA [Candidatus Brocadiales bacterium]